MVYCDFILYFINKNEALKIRLSGYNPDDDIEDWEEDDEWDDDTTRMTSMKPGIMASMMILILKEIGKKTLGVKKI